MGTGAERRIKSVKNETSTSRESFQKTLLTISGGSRHSMMLSRFRLVGICCSRKSTITA
nr:MAG TPA: hypothetical protein [Caudoviricetes sp.]